MPDESAFIRTILDHPDADGPRLVYADWLEEQGETARAEFIRVQVELSHLPIGDPRRDELVKRAEALFKRYRRRWVRRVGTFIRSAEFYGGLVHSVSMTANAFIRYGSRIFDRAPVLVVKLDGAAPVMERVVATSALVRLRGLNLRNNRLSQEHIDLLAEAPLVVGLYSVDLSENYVTNEGAAALAASRSLPALKRIRLEKCQIGSPGLAAIARAAWPNLKRLFLSQNEVGETGVAALVGGPLASQLTELDLSRNSLGPASTWVLAQSTRLTALTELDLSWNVLGNGGATALADAPGLSGLETLNLFSNGIGAAGARAIAQSRHLGGLYFLGLAGNRIGPAAERLLRRRFGRRVVLDETASEQAG
jgi:uncharacterized protein (TIGR02996 family)